MKRLRAMIPGKYISILRFLLMALTDIIIYTVSSLAALLVSYEFSFRAIAATSYINRYLSYSWVFAIIAVFIFIALRLYSSLWKYAEVDELFRIIAASILAAGLQWALTTYLMIAVPASQPLIHMLLLAFMLTASRYLYRFMRSVKLKYIDKGLINTMLIGGGAAGAMAIAAYSNSAAPTNKVVCVIDDDAEKLGSYIRGVKVVGDRSTIIENAAKYHISEIVFAIPSAGAEERQSILRICQNVKDCTLKILPEIHKISQGGFSTREIRRVSIEDVLSRPEIHVDLSEIAAYISGKTVLVTGGGGSIGTELCRQIARQDPALLIIFDISENGSYAIQQELLWRYPHLNVAVLIGSVRDKRKLDSVFNSYRPDYVFHAAAHKHVPLMETSPCKAVKNNVFGTWNTADAARRYGVKRFLLISTDKAINPTSVMGATKLICENIIGSMQGCDTEFVAVRFGNVLGSSGSVVPLFRSQIERGGPVTVTHPEITRYFMSIPEAVSLILQAGSYAKGGETFVLDMGKPVKIDELARNMIRLSGFEPDVDIKIKYTGLRPGEKLYEEPLIDGTRQRTPNELIFIERQPKTGTVEIDDMLARFKTLLNDGDAKALVDYMHQLLPTFIQKKNKIKTI